jgi:hypothetical protein
MVMPLPGLMLLAQSGQPERTLTAEDRARLLVAVASLALLSLFLIALAWVALRMVRRYVNRSSDAIQARTKSSHRDDDWADRPIVIAGRPENDDR